MNVYLPNLRLPSTYQEVEYIQSSGTQYIDTGIKGNISSNLSVDYKFTLVQNKSSGQQSIFGNIGSNGQGLTIYWDANSNQQGTWCGSGTGWYPGYITVGSATTINATFNKTSGRTFSINGTTYTNSASNPSIDNGLNYFIFNDGRSSLAGYFKINYFKIYKDGTLVRDLVPCYRKSDSVIGMYDLVNNQFYTNSGTGTFSKGSDVTMAELKNAYIGEVWTPNANTLAYRPLESNANDIVGGYNGTSITGISYDTLASGKKIAKTTSSSANISIPGESILPLLGTGDFTISCWVYLTGVYATGSNRAALIFWIGNNSSPYPGPSFFLNKSVTSWGNGGIFYSDEYNSGGNSTISYNDALNKWLNLVFTRDDGICKGYINGNTECTFSSSINYNTGNIGFLFCRLDSEQQLSAGSMGSEFILENKARTAQEIQDYYNNTKSNYGL